MKTVCVLKSGYDCESPKEVLNCTSTMTEGEEICTLDEMLHRGGKYYLTGRVWDYHW